VKRLPLQKTRHTALVVALAAGAVLGAVASALWVPAQVGALHERLAQQRRMYSALVARRADQLRDIGLFPQAYGLYRLAMDRALDTDSRNNAALGMALLLLKRAETEKHPYALMARQYLEALIESETRPERLGQAYRALVRAARLQEDTEIMLGAARRARELSACDIERGQLLLLEMDYLLEHGNWADMDRLTDPVETLAEHELWRDELALRQAQSDMKILVDARWFDAWAEQRGATNAVARTHARDALFRTTTARLERLAESAPERIAQNALFLSARLYHDNDDFAAAQRQMDLFLAREPSAHIKDALVLSLALARRQGRVRAARELIATFLRRYAWHDMIADDFMAVIEEAAAHGPPRETLDLIDQYTRLPISLPVRQTLLLKAGLLARDTGDDPRAERYFAELQNAGRTADDAIAARAMFERAAILMRQGADEAARRLLTAFVQSYPADERFGEALFALFDLSRRTGTDEAETIRLAMAAATEIPTDARTPATLLTAARRIEEMGAPALAQSHYAKIMLLQFMRLGRENEKAILNDSSTVAQAMLGNARSLLRMGEKTQADHVLRSLCNMAEPGAVRSEAAWLWATLALENGQTPEARRRLQRVDPQQADATIASRAALELLLMDLRAGAKTGEAAWALLPLLANMPSERIHADFLKKAYLSCFQRVAEENGIEAAQRFLESAAASPHGAVLPLREMSLRIGRRVLEQEGNAALIAFLERSAALIGTRQPHPVRDWDFLLQAARSVEKAREIVERYL
jgi:hypothetical protein